MIIVTYTEHSNVPGAGNVTRVKIDDAHHSSMSLSPFYRLDECVQPCIEWPGTLLTNTVFWAPPQTYQSSHLGMRAQNLLHCFIAVKYTLHKTYPFNNF